MGQIDRPPESPEQVFAELLDHALNQQRQRWRSCDIERSLAVQEKDWVARYERALREHA